MRLILSIIGVLLGMTSCQFTETEERRTILVNEGLSQVNWNDVDYYPNFGDCDPVAEKSKRLACFQQAFSAKCQRLIEELNYTVDKDIDERAELLFEVTHFGFVNLLDISASDYLLQELPQVEVDLRNLFSETITVQPAMKSGKQVSVRCSMQIDFKTK